MMYGKISLFLALAMTSAQAFSVSPSCGCGAASKTRFYMSDSGDEPSDSSSTATIDIESEALMPTMSEGIVSSIFDELPEGLVTSVSKETRANINEAILKLEKMNPTEDPSSSSMLNGVWNLRYAGGYDDDWALQSPTRQIALFAYSGGYSPGLFALSLASTLPSGLVELGELEIGESIVSIHYHA